MSAIAGGAPLLVLLVIAYLLHQLNRPEVLLVGDVTIDIVPDGSRPAGGSITYAAAVLSSLRIRACVVTVAGPDADLAIFAPHELYVVPSHATLTFEHRYSWWGHVRQLRVAADPNVTLSRRRHVPWHCQRARLVLLGPLTLHDVDAHSFLEYDGVWDMLMRGPSQHIAYMAQGSQRQLGPRGAVLPLTSPSDQLLAGLGKGVSIFLSDVETGPWSHADVARVARAAGRLLVTHGEKGAEEWNATGVHEIPVVPVDSVLDTNGAGDTFATVFALAQAWGSRDPGALASFAASRAVQVPQSCKPACVGDGWAHLVPPLCAAQGGRQGAPSGWPPLLKLYMDLAALPRHLWRVAQEAWRPAAESAAWRKLITGGNGAGQEQGSGGALLPALATLWRAVQRRALPAALFAEPIRVPHSVHGLQPPNPSPSHELRVGHAAGGRAAPAVQQRGLSDDDTQISEVQNPQQQYQQQHHHPQQQQLATGPGRERYKGGGGGEGGGLALDSGAATQWTSLVAATVQGSGAGQAALCSVGRPVGGPQTCAASTSSAATGSTAPAVGGCGAGSLVPAGHDGTCSCPAPARSDDADDKGLAASDGSDVPLWCPAPQAGQWGGGRLLGQLRRVVSSLWGLGGSVTAAARTSKGHGNAGAG